MAKHHCDKCRKEMEESQFQTQRNGECSELCKKCLTMHINNFDEDTYVWLLEKFDVPYVPEEWNILRDRAQSRDPNKINGMSVFGKYLSKMKLKQWKDQRWADTEKLQEEYKSRAETASEEALQREEKVKEQFENGEITEAQFKTLMSTTTLYNDRMAGVGISSSSAIGENNMYNENNFISQAELPDFGEELTPEDKKYLAMKWGRLYNPNEWVELERKYSEMVASFGVQDSDTEGTLILVCKTYLKMNQAIDNGDMEGYGKLSRVYESLRKSAKFTAAQNKDKKDDVVDCVGQLVEMCEKEEGFIPRFVTDVPQDKVDATLLDMNNYVQKLVTQDLGFGQQIEDALKKIQIQKEMNEEENELEEPQLKDQDYADFYDNLQEQKLQDLDEEEDD